MTDQERIGSAINIAIQFGGIDGAHHKDWVIDQMLRVLCGDGYDATIAESCDGEDGPNSYEHSVGVAP